MKKILIRFNRFCVGPENMRLVRRRDCRFEHVISFLKQKGHKWYEVGGGQPFSHDPKLKGIYMFKKGWGGTLVRGYMMRREYPSPTLSLLKTLKKLKTISLI